LKLYFIDEEGRITYCRSCLPEHGFKSHWYPNLSPELKSYYLSEHIPFEEIPPHNPDCQRVFGDMGPDINSLQDGAEYILIKSENQQLKLSCMAEADVTRVYWYLDDWFLGSADADEDTFFTPLNPGKIKISCTDDKGRNRDIWVYVRFI
jgi:penicillin-binding protein 1C